MKEPLRIPERARTAGAVTAPERARHQGKEGIITEADRMNKVTKDNAFYRNFFSIYVALVLQNVVTLSVNLADNIMLGAYGETELAGVVVVI